MGRWLVILSLAVVQYPEIAMASSESSNVPLWKRLLSVLTPASQPALPDQAQPVKAATPDSPEPVAESQAREPLNSGEPVIGWQVLEPLKFPEPLTGPQVRELTDSAEPVTGSQARKPLKSNLTDCNGGKRIMSAFYWQGQRTASGQRFDPQGMTAAHRTLPFGTRLTVTNPRTGKSVTVVINDRGPFVSGISLDLSLGAAQTIGMHGTGAVCIL